MSAEQEKTSSSTLKPEGHTFLALVATNGSKERRTVNQPVLSAETTNIVMLLESSTKAESPAGSVSTRKAKATKITSLGRKGMVTHHEKH